MRDLIALAEDWLMVVSDKRELWHILCAQFQKTSPENRSRLTFFWASSHHVRKVILHSIIRHLML